jgi:hypothetical protein
MAPIETEWIRELSKIRKSVYITEKKNEYRAFAAFMDWITGVSRSTKPPGDLQEV